MVREHRLVGGDHVFARCNGGLGRRLGGAVASAHQLDKDVDIIASGQGDRIVFPGVIGEGHAAILVAAAGRNGGDHHRAARPDGQKLGFLADDLDDTGADRAQSGDAEAQGCVHGALRLSLKGFGCAM